MSLRQAQKFFSQRNGAAALFAISLPLTMPALAHSGKPAFSETNVAKRQTAAGYPYQNGGFTFDEQKMMARAAHGFNLRLTFTSKAGALAVPDFVVIGTNKGGAVEKVALTAPWFHIQLPPGAYTVLARFRRGVVLIRDIHLNEGQSRLVRVRTD